MELESYFDFINEEAIRIKGTRIGIETIVRDYLQGAGPEEIVLHYPTLTLEQVHATITYYLANRDKVALYMARVRQLQEEGWLEQEQHPSEFVQSLRERLEQHRQIVLDNKLVPHTNKPAQKLYGTLGQGSWAEYDPDLDWQRV